jgi:hypothetical protein
LPQESRYGITRSLLAAMLDDPPDLLIVQTHSHRVIDSLSLLAELRQRCELRVHLSIETDRERIERLPPHASSVAQRFAAAAALKQSGLTTVVTVSPLLPIERPDFFFRQISEVADAVVIDHFIQGDGSPDGSRTLRTPLPNAMSAIEPASVTLTYRDQMVAIASRWLPGRVGVNIDGFAGRWTSAANCDVSRFAARD